MVGEPSDQLGDALLTLVPRSPDVLPQKVNLAAMSVLLVQLDSAAYRAASFLDDRVLNPRLKGAWVPLERLVDASRSLTAARPLHFIFHTGHVGSTLVSRLLDETGAALSLREPLPLRTFSEAYDVLGQPESLLSATQFERALETFLNLWSRGYATTGCVVVKATSSAGNLAGPILARSERSRAIYLNLRPEPYLAALLAGANSQIDLRGHGPFRMRRLRSRITREIAPLHTLSPGQLAALSWLAESFSQSDARRQFQGRVLSLDFDAFLADVEGGLARILAHFGLSAERRVAEIARGPVLLRYSKAPEYAFAPRDRQEMLRESRDRNREEIRKGLGWLEQLARADEAAAEVVADC